MTEFYTGSNADALSAISSLKRLADVAEQLRDLAISILQAALKEEPNAELEAILKRIRK